jgi:hypothetical protein
VTMAKLGLCFCVLGISGALACGGSEKTKPDGAPAKGGAASAGASGSGSAGLAGAGGGGAGSAGFAGAAGAVVAGSAGLGGGGAGSGGGGDGGDGDEGGAAGEGGGGSGPTATATKVDVLFVVDNSISMFEKQTVLAEAVPTLVARLVDPHCVFGDSTTVPPTNGVCPQNSVREIAPVRDMHVGVITTALGSRGGPHVCVPSTDGRPLNDRAHLMGTVRTGLTSWNDSGFLKWDPDALATPAGEASAEELTSALQAMIAAAGDTGCGYEAPLEALYRFLVDPAPPLDVTNDGIVTVLTGIDTALLEQRAAFLRPDSAVVVVLLSDEDDCSIVAEPNRQGWLLGNSALRMPRASAACAHPEDPNVYRCCIPCVLLDSPSFVPPTGCVYDLDLACNTPQTSGGHSLTSLEDSTNLRCFRQKQRFGLDLLYPVERYVTGLTSPEVENREGAVVPNPLFAGGRSPELVLLTTIVGVPWQDLVIATEDFDGYDLMTAKELRDRGRFPIILGDFAAGVPPGDPFMIDSIDARSGTNPITNQAIAPPTAMPTATINGHEIIAVNRDDLQYACTFELPEPIPCTTENQDGCDCNTEELPYSRPLCQNPAGTGAQETTQYFAKAYPGRRELEVARRLRDQAVISSICPRTLEDPSHPSYGYVPAMRAIQRQLRGVLVP